MDISQLTANSTQSLIWLQKTEYFPSNFEGVNGREANSILFFKHDNCCSAKGPGFYETQDLICDGKCQLRIFVLRVSILHFYTLRQRGDIPFENNTNCRISISL